MKSINNQNFNTAMMKKLLFVGTAVLAISATALQAETVTNQGVTYDVALTNSSSSTTTGSLKSKVRSYDYSNYKLILDATREDIKNVTETYTATATATTLASVTFDSWTSDPVTTAGEPEIVTSNPEIDTDVTDIFTTRFTELMTFGELEALENQINDEDAFEYFYSGVKTKKTRTKDAMMQKISNYADILYYVEEEEGEYTVYALSIYEERINTTVTTKTTPTYNVTTIPAGVINANVTSLTIGSNIKTIENDAFANANAIEIISASGSKYTTVNNKFLYTANKGTLLYVTTNYLSESLELSALTTSVGNYATVGLTSDKIIYYSSTSLSIGSNQGATFISKTPSITWFSKSEQIYVADATSYVNATVLKKALESLEGSTACVDLRNAKLATDINLDVNYGNIMVILPSNQGVSVGGINVIYLGSDGYVCEDFVLNDSYSTNGFYTPIAFTATEANYDRKFTSNNSTVCLPFSFTVPNTLTVATMANSNSEGVIFAEVTETQAGKPYLIFSNSDNATIPTMQNVSVSATTSSNKIGEYEMIGVYEPTTLSAADGNFYGFSSNSLVKITGTATANVKVFRAYLSVEGGSAATMRVSIEAENETNAIEELEATNDDDAAVYNLNGQKIDSKAAGFQILSNGTKRIIK